MKEAVIIVSEPIPARLKRKGKVLAVTIPTQPAKAEKKMTPHSSKASVHTICPVCESTVVSVRCKLVCPNCHSIVQSCCD